MVDERNSMLAENGTNNSTQGHDGEDISLEKNEAGDIMTSAELSSDSVSSEAYTQDDTVFSTGLQDDITGNGATYHDPDIMSSKVLHSDLKDNDEYSYVDEQAYEDGESFEPNIIIHGYEHNFKGFLSEFFDVLGRWLKKNTASVIGFIVIVILVVGGVIFYKNYKNNNDAASASDNVVDETSEGTASINEIVATVEELKEDVYPEVNDIIVKYFNAMRDNDIDTYALLRGGNVDSIEKAKVEIKARYVEDYKNITCYTKNGPIENSYIVYVKYDVKLKDWDMMAPSLLTVVLYPNSDNSLYIYTGDFDENMAAYISEASSQDDVVDLITKVDAEYKEVLDTNIEFSEYMNALNQTIKNEVGELIAAETSPSENQAIEENPVDENPNEQPVEPETPAEPENTTFEVKATTTVNVRMSDSEDADKLGKVEGGTVLTCNEQRPNGWSQVVYEGQTAYIKTEYLERVGGDNGNDAQANTAEATGTVRVKETVNIRSQASTDGKQLGVAYMGETFPLVEKRSDGWSQIIYNDKEAYVKTEYLED